VRHGCGPQVCRDTLRTVCQKFWPRICSDIDKLIYVGKFAVHEFNPRKCREMFTYKFLTHLLAAYMRENGYWLNRATSWHGRWWFWGLLLQSQQQHQQQWSPWQHAAERDFSCERAFILHSPHRGYVNWCASGHELGPKGTQHQASVFRLMLSVSYCPVWLWGNRMRSHSAKWSRSASLPGDHHQAPRR